MTPDLPHSLDSKGCHSHWLAASLDGLHTAFERQGTGLGGDCGGVDVGLLELLPRNKVRKGLGDPHTYLRAVGGRGDIPWNDGACVAHPQHDDGGADFLNHHRVAMHCCDVCGTPPQVLREPCVRRGKDGEGMGADSKAKALQHKACVVDGA